MALASEPPGGSFRLSMLIYDTRYRSKTIQIVFLFVMVMAFWWVVDNVLVNLAQKGKDINFAYLNSRAGYDINQTLVSYTNDSTHARAWLVGLANTLVLAVASCFSATVVGVFVGVLRLSKNWLISKAMAIYVEMFRNVPLLLWIVAIFAVLSETMPVPRDFVGDAPTASMLFWDSFAITNRGTYVPTPLFERSLGTVAEISLNYLAILLVLIGSYLAYRAVLRNATAVQFATGTRPATWWKSLLILLAPIVLLLVALGFHLDYPQMGKFNFSGGGFIRNSFIAMWLALTLYTGAFIAENVRSGILAVSRGQTEAAYALGLQPGRTMKLVVLPQALRVIIPPLISQYLNITKNTSLALAVGYMDLRSTLGGITLNQTGRELESMLLMMMTYLVLSLIISGAMNIYNNSIKLKER